MQVWAYKGDRKGVLEVTSTMKTHSFKSSAAKISLILVLVLLSMLKTASISLSFQFLKIYPSNEFIFLFILLPSNSAYLAFTSRPKNLRLGELKMALE